MKNKILFCIGLLSLSWSNMEAQHVVTVILTAKKDHIEEVKQGLLAVVTPSRNEKTNLLYRLSQDANRPEVFALFEIWTSAEDHAKQFEKDYILQLMQQLDGKLEKPYEGCFGPELSA